MILQVKDILGILNTLGRVRDYVTFTPVNADPVCTIACIGYITVESTKDGAYKKETYRNLTTPTLLAIQADAGTEIKIKGRLLSFSIDALTNPIADIDVTHAYRLAGLEIYNSTIDHLDLTNNYRLSSLSVAWCGNLEELDVQNCPLVELNCDHCSNLRKVYLNSESNLQQLNLIETAISGLDLSSYKELSTVELLWCQYLTTLDISGSEDIHDLVLTGCDALYSIRTRAQSQFVVTSVAAIIQENAGLHGVVYANPEDLYYPDIETAALNNGWTIEEL